VGKASIKLPTKVTGRYVKKSPTPKVYTCSNKLHKSRHLYVYAMATLRPAILDAALRACTRAQTRRPAPRNTAQNRPQVSRRTQRRCISDDARPPLPRGTPGPSKVVAPKTRLAVGVVFIGTLIYSMVHHNQPDRGDPQADHAPQRPRATTSHHRPRPTHLPRAPGNSSTAPA